MARLNRGLAKHTLTYGAGSVLVAAGAFLLIPVYTHHLSTAEFGALEILNRIADVLLIVMFLGMRQSYIRIFFDDDAEGWGDTVTATFLLFCLFSCAVVASILYPWAGSALSKLYGDPSLDELFSLLLIGATFSMFANVVMTYFQARTWSKVYVMTSILHLVTFVALTLYLLVVLKMGVRGALWANILAAGVVATLGTIYLFTVVGFRFSPHAFMEMIKFGLPYLPAAVFMYVINNADRYFLSIHETFSAVGIYALSFKIALVGGIFLIEPFLKIWSPFLFQTYRDKDGPEAIANVFRYFCIVCVGFATFISILAPSIVTVISDSEYHSAALLIPPLAAGFVFYAAQHIADAGILISKKTSVKPIIFGLGAMTAILLNAILVPWLGLIGATIASVVTYFVLLIATIGFSNYFFRLPFNYPKFVLTILAGTATYVFARILVFATGNKAAFLVSVAGFMLFPLIIWFGSILSTDEKKQLRRIFVGIGSRFSFR